MRLLVLGGTRFLGRSVVEAALASGDRVTLFNRGRTNPGLFPEAEHLTGDRDGGLDRLSGRDWDAVVDTCGYLPRVVGQSARLLAGRVGHYCFVSSLSVYPSPRPGGDEDDPVATLADPASEDIARDYGALKAACERVVAEALPGRTLSVRSGMIVGPWDPLNRFPYWLRRLSQGGEVLAPGDPGAPVQIIDARDLAGWILAAARAGTTGTFDASGPAERLDFAGFLARIDRALGGNSRFTWVADSALVAAGIEPCDGLPYWLPGPDRALFERSLAGARAAGLVTRPLEDTARDTWRWLRDRPGPPGTGGLIPIHSGIPREREQEILTAWHAAGT